MTSLMLLPTATSTMNLDWPSLAWAAILGGLTFACLRVKSRFPAISEQGALARVLAHLVIGYFSIGMTAFGAFAAFNAEFPVPGGAAWTGPVAVIGGFAAITIGT